MPIYQRRVFSLVKPLEGNNSEDSVYTIPHTGEKFKDESEYRSRCELYAQEIWTCQCTGHTGLTHKEAWDSEHKIRNMLEASFPEFLHKPILSVVHHNTKSLDNLIDEVFNLIHSRFHKDEPVSCLKLEKAKGVVLEVTDPESVTSSPSSDKENKAGQQQPAQNGRGFPALLPLRYSVRLDRSGRVVTGLTQTEISRAERLPSRDLLRLFIRSSAIRQGTTATAPWIVSAPLFVKHGLKNKIASIFLPSSERKNNNDASLPPKKRKLQDSSKDKPAKKAKPDGSATKKKPDTQSSKKPNSISKPLASKKIAVTVASKLKSTSQDSDSDGEVLASIASKPSTPAVKSVSKDSDSEAEILASIASSSKAKYEPKVVVSPMKDRQLFVVTPTKAKPASADGDSDDSDDVKLSVIAKSPTKKLSLGSSSTSKKALLGKKQTGKADPKEKKKREKKPKDKDKDKKAKDKGAGPSKKADGKGAEKKKRGRPLKADGMRQMSLFDLGKKKPSTPQKKDPQKTPSSSPQKTPSKKSPQKPPALPPCVRKLSREIESGRRVNLNNALLKMCVKVLKKEQFPLIKHQATREMIERRRAKVDEERLLSRMTPEQKEEYLRKKKVEQDEERRAKLNEKRMRFEDSTLQLAPLPAPAPVRVPEGMPAALFGDVAMVSEFVHAYSGLLLPPGVAPVPAEQLMLALAGHEHKQHKVFLDVVTMLLKAFLNDEVAEGFRELSTPLRQIPASPQTASELVRLALRPADAHDTDSQASDNHEESTAIEEQLSSDLLARLEMFELYELTAAERCEVLRVLVHRLLACDALAEHQDELEERHRALWNQKHAVYRLRKEQKRKEGGQASKPATPPPEPAPEEAPPPAEGEEVTRRTSRRNLEEARREKERLEKEAKERRYQEQQRLKKELEEAAVFREFDVVAAQHALVQRRAPLGSDRRHRRYWLFTSLPAALYVEDGWADRETTEYRVPPPAGAPRDPESDDEQPLTAVQRKVAADRGRTLVADRQQTTVPTPKPNQWYCYRSVSEVERLAAALAEKGERESILKDALAANIALIKSRLPPEIVPESSPSDAASSGAKQEPPAKTEPGSQNGPAAAENGEVPASDEVKATEEVKMEVDEAPESAAKSDAAGTTDVQSEAAVKPETEAKPEPKEEMSGRQFLLSTLKEDIISIEEELSEGWLGAVPDLEVWTARVLSAESPAELADTILECQRHVGRHALQAPLAPPAGDSGVPSAAESRWADAVVESRTLSRLHVLVGLLDSAIKWDLSTAKKKCKVCRRKEGGPMSLCRGCSQLYHWSCLRPHLFESPPDDWLCPGCRPRTPRAARARTRPQPVYEQSDEESEVESPKKESECRVCGSPEEENMIHCTQCPAAFHKSCHDPPMLLRVRPGWECMDCKGAPKKRRGKNSKQPLPSAVLRAARLESANPSEEEDEEEGEEEEDEEPEENGEEEADDGEDREEEMSAEEQEEAVEEEKPVKTSRGRVKPQASATPVVYSDEEAEEDEDAAESAGRRPSRSSRSKPRRYVDSDDSEAEGARRQRRRPAPRPRAAPRRAAVVESESDEEARIRALSSDEDEVPRPRRSSASRRAELRARAGSRRQPRKSYTEKSESDLEPSESGGEGAQQGAGHAPTEPPQKPSPSKVELIQQVGAVCMYCEQPRTHRNELAVCQSCPSLYHRRCASRAGLVDAWQCSLCVMPAVYRARPVKPRTSDDFEYEE